MEKEFIPYEQALALKELGFDEPCVGCYIERNFNGGVQSSRVNVVNQNHFANQVCSRPLYSQAFRWFREKYNLKGFISPVEYLDGTDDTYHWCIYNKCNSGNDQLTYEEAELECLKKLIENCKK